MVLSHVVHHAVEVAPAIAPAAALPTKLTGTVPVVASQTYNASSGFTNVSFSGVGYVNPLGSRTRVLIGIEFAPTSSGTLAGAASMLAVGKYTSFAALTLVGAPPTAASGATLPLTFSYTIISGAGSLRMRSGYLVIHASGNRDLVTFA